MTKSKYPIYNFFRKSAARWNKCGWGRYKDGAPVDLVKLRNELPTCLCLGGALRYFYAPNRFITVTAHPGVNAPEAFVLAIRRVHEELNARHLSKNILYTNDEELNYATLLAVTKAAKV